MKNFYVYRHIRLDTNTPFYIGKGKGYRAYIKTNRNSYWNNIVSSVGYKVEIVIINLTETEAFAEESSLIKLYKSFGHCEANLSDGGEGPSNPSTNTRMKMRLAKLGKPSSVNKQVIDKASGQIYSSVTEAAQKIGLKRTTLNAMLRGQSKNKTNLTYI